MCTVIPTDHKSPTTTPLLPSVFNGILASLQICLQGPDPATLGGSLQTINPEPRDGEHGPVSPHFEFICDTMKRNTDCSHFIISGRQWYTCALQALMLWCIREEPRSVCLYIVDESFNRPANWSYRYFWRYQSKCSKGGISIQHVGVLAEEMRRVCSTVVMG